LHTTDGGTEWNGLYIGTGDNLYHVAFTDSLHGCIVGWGGGIYRTGDGGETWSRIASGTPRDFYGLTFADSLIGYAVGDGIVNKTIDGGITWQNQNAGIETAWRNVVATKPGTTQPGRQVIICAHYDDTSEMPSNRAPGADDNGSGATAVIEAARILSAGEFEKTIKFCLWSGEEQGLLGSAAYAAEAAARGDTIAGVFNYDMIAWDGNGDNSVELHCGTMGSSLVLGNLFGGVVTDYNIALAPDILTWQSTDRSDHASFWDNNYPAMLGIEDFSSDFNPFYHTTSDNMSHIDTVLFTSYVKAGIGAAASLSVIDTTGEAVGDDSQVPRSFMLLRNYPNPFNSSTLISFSLQDKGDIDLTIYDLLGRKVTTLASGPMEAGSHSVSWNAGRCASGIYLCRLRTGETSEVARMMLVK
jgi:aminopeptidase YwaD